MNVLIAEDDTISRRLLEVHLRRWGYEVTAAADGAEAWRLFQEGAFGLVVSDWMMPAVDGVELVRRIRAAEGGEGTGPAYVYTLLLTAKADKQDLVEGMEAGADDFLTKPFDPEELRVRVRAGERIVLLEERLAEQNRALRETQAALAQSEKMASLGTLAAGVAHEINNPVAYVMNNLAVLRRDTEGAMELLERYREGREALARADPERAAAAERLEEEIDLPYLQENLGPQFDKSLAGMERVREIVRSLRDFVRLDEAEFKEADLNAGLSATLEMLRHELKRHETRLALETAPLPPVPCHPGKINQVFMNLICNAIQACAPGGMIEVRTRAGEGEVIIEVEDDGTGIPSENLPRLFEPFFTTKPVGQGTGLGLSISHGIVRDHGGAIEVESEPGKGSLFRVRLPVEAGKHAGAQETAGAGGGR